MKLIKQSKDQCLIYATAMVLDISPKQVIASLGHDGLEVVWSEMATPWCYRGVHIQEIIDICWNMGVWLTPIDAMPLQAPNIKVSPYQTYKNPEVRLINYLSGRKAILISNTHAYAWDGKTVYDPRGKLLQLEDVNIREAWVLNQC